MHCGVCAYSAYASTCLDDVAIFSSSWEEHLKHLKEVLQTLKEARLTIKPSKCHFAKGTGEYLGHSWDHTAIAGKSRVSWPSTVDFGVAL